MPIPTKPEPVAVKTEVLVFVNTLKMGFAFPVPLELIIFTTSPLLFVPVVAEAWKVTCALSLAAPVTQCNLPSGEVVPIPTFVSIVTAPAESLSPIRKLAPLP